MSTSSTPTLTEFTNLCGDIFKKADLSPDDNVLDSGGDSIRVALLAVELDERWGIHIDIFDVYTAANIRELYNGVLGISNVE